MGTAHDGAGSQGGVGFAFPATQDDGGSGGKAIRFLLMAAFGTSKSGGPAQMFEILGAGVIIGKGFLKLGETGGKAAKIHKLK